MEYSELVKALRETATFTKFDDLLSKREQKLESLAFDAADAIEALQAQLPKRGEWVGVSPTVDTVQCSVCGGQLFSEELETPYCPYCGAKMDGTPDKRYSPSVCLREIYAKRRDPDWFCADGERKEDKA